MRRDVSFFMELAEYGWYRAQTRPWLGASFFAQKIESGHGEAATLNSSEAVEVAGILLKFRRNYDESN
jgi:hypothetical protein